jgi:SAM-dependent methyltransferase
VVEEKFGNLSVFDEIYATSYWGNGSGGGSSIEATLPYKKFIERFLRDHAIKSIVDLGCGDWQFSRFLDFGDASYKGFDVAETVVRENQKSFSSDTISFERLTSYEDLPTADLLICKDVLQHLSNDEVKKALSILPRYKFALITNDISPMSGLGQFLWKTRHPSSAPLVNGDIKIGDYRPLDPTQEPFGIKATLAFQWKVNKFGIKQRLSRHNLVYGISSEWTKRTYLYTS